MIWSRTLINPNNKTFIDNVLVVVHELEQDPYNNALVYDLYIALKKARDAKGDEYPRCSKCRRPAHGVSFKCSECAIRHSEGYAAFYRGRADAYDFEGEA